MCAIDIHAQSVKFLIWPRVSRNCYCSFLDLRFFRFLSPSHFWLCASESMILLNPVREMENKNNRNSDSNSCARISMRSTKNITRKQMTLTCRCAVGVTYIQPGLAIAMKLGTRVNGTLRANEIHTCHRSAANERHQHSA